MRELCAYITLFLHFTLAACANNGKFHTERGTKLTAQPFKKYTAETVTLCALKCLTETEQPCIAYIYSTSSYECGLHAINNGKIPSEEHTVGVRGELITVYGFILEC